MKGARLRALLHTRVGARRLRFIPAWHTSIRSGFDLGFFGVGARARVGVQLSLLTGALLSACASSDHGRLKHSRDAFLRDDFKAAEVALYGPEVYENEQNRLLHYYLLASIAMAESQYAKAIYFLDRAREVAISVRSDSGSWELFSSQYKSNPIEYSHLHGMLVMAYSMLASDGKAPAWSTPEIKDKKGNVLVQAMSFPEKTYLPREIAELKQKARAELRAWDVFLETLKRTNPEREYYHEDLWGRLLASFVHGISEQNHERRTAELLAQQAGDILQRSSALIPSRQTEGPVLEKLIARLQEAARTPISKTAKQDTRQASMLVVEAGVMPNIKIRRYHLGLSTLFQHIQDPLLRSQMEQIGLHVLFEAAPEFGLIAFTGAIAGAADDDEFEGPPRFFTDAVDRSFGFEIRFPSLQRPPADTRLQLNLKSKDGAISQHALPVVNPLQETFSIELEKREEQERWQRSIRIGMQYLAILIPAIQAYRKAADEGDLFKRLAILAGYFIAKKVIDRANQPDTRSWSTLPQLVAAQIPSVGPGSYEVQVWIENSLGRYESDWFPVQLGNPSQPLIRKRIGSVPILNRSGDPIDQRRVP
jgi:hypothetical protein